MTAYTDPAAVAAYLGTELTPAQQAQAAVLAEAATSWVERYTGRTWQGVAILGEQHTVAGPWVYLQRAPVASVQAVTVRVPYVGAVAQPLTAGTGYELLDAPAGLLLVQAWLDDWPRVEPFDRGARWLSVDYTPATPVPAAVALGTALLAAAWLRPTLYPERAGLKSWTVGADNTRLEFAVPTPDAALPPEAVLLLAPYRQMVMA